MQTLAYHMSSKEHRGRVTPAWAGKNSALRRQESNPPDWLLPEAKVTPCRTVKQFDHFWPCIMNRLKVQMFVVVLGQSFQTTSGKKYINRVY